MLLCAIAAPIAAPLAADRVTAVAQPFYGELPLAFVRNDGQLTPAVKYYQRGGGYATYFCNDGVYLVFPLRDPSGVTRYEQIKLRFESSSEHPEITAGSLLAGKINYLVGRDPQQWRTNIPTYGEVIYKQIYPGIDIKFYGNHRRLEYDIVVQPGARPEEIRFAYEGVNNIAVAEGGELETDLEHGTLVQKRPYIYQWIDGRRVAVAGRFKVYDPGTASASASTRASYGFELAAYDERYPLIIDPILEYSTYLGGGGVDKIYDIAVDSGGNAYVTGETTSNDFPIFPLVPAPYQTVRAGNSDVFVTKLNPAGTALVYSTYLGGGAQDIGYGIAVDGSGAAYVTGLTKSATDFPTTAFAYQVGYQGNPSDGFIAKLDATGSNLVYATYLGGAGGDNGYAIGVDASGNAYVTGSTTSSNFPTPSGYQSPPFAGSGGDAFVAKLNSTGSNLLYGTYHRGTNADTGFGISVTGSIVYVTGVTGSAAGTPGIPSSDFPTTSGAFQGALNGSTAAFIAKIDTSLSGIGSLVYSTYLGGGGADTGYDVTVDGSGNAYVAGSTTSTNFPTTANALYTAATTGGGSDAFVAKLNPAGSGLVYSTYYGGSGTDVARGIGIDSLGNAYIAGETNSSTSFPQVMAVQGGYGGNGTDAFVAKIGAPSSGPGTIFYSTFLGGGGREVAHGIKVGAAGAVYVAGETNSVDYPTVTPLQGTRASNNFDGFVSRLGEVIILTITTSSVPDATQGVYYSATLGAEGGYPPYTWSLVGGVLPPGLSLGTNTGMISGTPTATGTFNFTIRVDNGIFDTQTLTIVVSPPPVVSAVSLPGGTVGAAYAQTLTATGGTPLLVWSLSSGSLPPGLLLNADTGEISGTPTTPGTYNFTVQVIDNNGAIDTQALAITVNAAPAITSASLSAGTAGAAYSQSLAMTGGTAPLTWSVSGGALPPGVTLNPSTGEISGTPTTPGTYNFTVQVADNNGAVDTQALSVIVNPAPVITTTSGDLATGSVGDVYSTNLTASGGTAPLAWSVVAGSLPPGLTLNAATGVISGTPTAAGDFSFTVQAADGNGASASASLVLKVIAVSGGACTGSSAVTDSGSNITVRPDARVGVTYTTVTGSGNTCVVISSTSPGGAPAGYSLGNPQRFFDITTTAAFAGTAQVCITYDQTRYKSERVMRLFHWTGSAWNDVTTNHDANANLVCGVTTSFSPFTVGEEASTAITLSDFNAVAGNEGVVVRWTTRSETGNWGFRLLRAEAAGGPYAALTADLIPARGGPGLTMTYTYADTTAAPGTVYYYQLQDVDTQGLVTAHARLARVMPERATAAVASSEEVGARSGGGRRPGAGSAGTHAASRAPAVAPPLIAGGGDMESVARSAEVVSPARPVGDGLQPRVASSRAALRDLATSGMEAAPGQADLPVEQGAARAQPPAGAAPPAAAAHFSVSIRDGEGNTVSVQRVAEQDPERPPAGLSVREESGKMRISWRITGSSARGFRLLRAERGTGRFAPVFGFVPNFGGANDGATYVYDFLDQSARQGRRYEYRLEVETWGVRIASAH